jgi:hypothetical protein
MHFTSTHETITGSDFEIRGLANTSVFDELTATDAVDALRIAEGMLSLLLLLRGIPQDHIPAALHVWTGLPPSG